MDAKFHKWGWSMGDEIKHIIVVDEVNIAAVDETRKVEAWTCYSVEHLRAAACLARKSWELEQEYDANAPPAVLTEHRACIVGAIMLSVAFLEAAINEFFLDACMGQLGRGKEFDDAAVKAVADAWRGWNCGGKRVSTLEKYQRALALTGHERFDEGRLPYQDAYLVTKLRDALVHYKPEPVTVWATDPREVAQQEIEKKLRSKKLPENPFVGSGGQPYFPNRCLSYGCGRWAIHSVVNLTDKFYNIVGLQPPYERVRPELQLP